MKLKPCPFCGTDETREPVDEDDTLDVCQRRSIGLYHVICPECGASGPYESTFDQAATAWNERIDAPKGKP